MAEEEYLDEAWPTGPQLLPKEPYLRAKVHFGVAYISQVFIYFIGFLLSGRNVHHYLVLVQTLQTVSKLYEPNNEGQEKIVEEVHEKLKILEDGVKKFYFPEGSPVHIDAEKLGILDIMVFATFGGYKAQEQVLGVKIIDAEQTPLIFSWLQAPNEVSVIKESAVPHDHLVGLRQFLTQSAGSQ
nr:glutathione S-transferase U10-like [Coffea arabica]